MLWLRTLSLVITLLATRRAAAELAPALDALVTNSVTRSDTSRSAEKRITHTPTAKEEQEGNTSSERSCV